MVPKVVLYKAPEGLEALSLPKEMDAPRTHIVYMIANLMKLYGVERIECNMTMLGPCGVTSPAFKAIEAYKKTLPHILQLTQVTAMKSVIPLMTTYGILSMDVEYDEQDHIGMLSLWGGTGSKRAAQPERAHKPVIPEVKDAGTESPAKPQV